MFSQRLDHPRRRTAHRTNRTVSFTLWSLLAVLFLAANPAVSAQRPTAGEADDSGSVLYTGSKSSGKLAQVSAAFSWAMQSRAVWSQHYYHDDTGAYDRDYIYPEASKGGPGWLVLFDACDSEARYTSIVAYRWQIQGAEPHNEHFNASLYSAECKLDGANDAMQTVWFPERGRYEVSLTVLSKDRQIQDTHRQQIEIKDKLIVSLGDSASSGEGSPNFGDTPWYDESCHRSVFAAHYNTAMQIDASNPHEAVTFLSYACSGAKTKHLWSDAQKTNRPPQIDQVVRDVCGGDSCVSPEDRSIDRLMFTIGVNDVHFSDIVLACLWENAGSDYKSHLVGLLAQLHPVELIPDLLGTDENCIIDLDGFVLEMIGDLPALYTQLGDAISQTLHPEHVITSYYPSELFTDSKGEPAAAVGGLIDEAEAAWINERGNSINLRLFSAARANGWEYTSEVEELFDGHGYSAKDPYFVRVTESFSEQGDKDGSMHPNREGQDAWSIAWRNASDRVSRPEQQVAVVFTELCVDTSAVGASLLIGAGGESSPYPPEGELVTPYSWVALPKDQFRFEVNGHEGDLLRIVGSLSVPGVLVDKPKHPGSYEVTPELNINAVDEYVLDNALEYGSQFVLQSDKTSSYCSAETGAGFKAKYRLEGITNNLPELISEPVLVKSSSTTESTSDSDSTLSLYHLDSGYRR